MSANETTIDAGSVEKDGPKMIPNVWRSDLSIEELKRATQRWHPTKGIVGRFRLHRDGIRCKPDEDGRVESMVGLPLVML